MRCLLPSTKVTTHSPGAAQRSRVRDWLAHEPGEHEQYYGDDNMLEFERKKPPPSQSWSQIKILIVMDTANTDAVAGSTIAAGSSQEHAALPPSTRVEKSA